MAVEVDMFHNYLTHSIRRTGHARFRRGPADQITTTSTSSHCNDQAEQSNVKFKVDFEAEAKFEECKSGYSSIISEISAIAGDEATVSNGKIGEYITGVARNYSSRKPPLPLSHLRKWRDIKQCVSTDSPKFSSAKPPLPSSHRKRRRDFEQVSGDRLRSHSCHCCKRR